MPHPHKPVQSLDVQRQRAAIEELYNPGFSRAIRQPCIVCQVPTSAGRTCPACEDIMWKNYYAEIERHQGEDAYLAEMGLEGH